MKRTALKDTLASSALQEDSLFKPENLLREARRQMGVEAGKVPPIVVLDPDGDLADYLLSEEKAVKDPYWACYHSKLYDTTIEGRPVGVLPVAVGASYATLVAEQLFVSGCELLISITSAGIVQAEAPPKDFALITEALRDEGTSAHYIHHEEPSRIGEHLLKGLEGSDFPWFSAKSWTTDAPYRETQSILDEMRKDGVTCVEMEAAALYAFAKAREKNVICFAHLTNTMAQQEGDFEKGEAFGSLNTLRLLHTLIPELEKQNIL